MKSDRAGDAAGNAPVDDPVGVDGTVDGDDTVDSDDTVDGDDTVVDTVVVDPNVSAPTTSPTTPPTGALASSATALIGHPADAASTTTIATG
ncbi:MAG: hypothetical protein EXR73_06275 [Myxococcales bacterium]|nr:hypothetical protein [Myxococcales bacterium]